METKTWTKKDKIACVSIFVVAIIVFVTFLSTITLSFFYDIRTESDTITAGQANFTVSGGPNNDGVLSFPSPLTPNTYYLGSDYKTGNNLDMVFTIKNTSNFGAVYVMLQIDSDYWGYLNPVLSSNWVYGKADGYFFYMVALGKNASVNFNTGWTTGNFTVPLMGSRVNMTFNTYVVQAEGGAVDELVLDSSSPWYYAPQVFIDMATA